MDTPANALLHMVVDVADEAEQGNNRHVCLAFVQHLVCIVGDEHAGFQTQPGVIAHIHAHHLGIHINGAHNLCAVLVQITQGVLGHFTAAVLHNLNFFHSAIPPCSREPMGFEKDTVLLSLVLPTLQTLIQQ